MYSVKDISESLDVSRQTVYNYLKEHSSELKDHTIKQKGTTYITDEGLKLIKIAMGLIQVPMIQENDISIGNIVEDIKEGLMEEIRAENLKQQEVFKQIQESLNKEIQEVKKQNEKLIEMMEQNQNKKGFFSRLFKK